ncbi:MAG: LarC family nickel insertion protein [bacterium]|nr:LarC family nickel insertion protein [bacterium]
MKLLIDPRGGMAGDMFSAALVSAGADFNVIKETMRAAGRELGTVKIELKKAPDGASQMVIQLDSKRNHLGGNEARRILTKLFDQFHIRDTYRNLGMTILDILIKAEIRAHKEFNIVVEGDHGHSHSNDHNDHEHPHDEETFLHEAQDIVIDILGAVTAMQQLDLDPEAELCAPISVGGGHVHFSHGTLSVPAPATSIILEQYGLEWKKGPIEKELFTPTGAAILAALGSKVNLSIDVEAPDIYAAGTARGTKILDIPPLKVFLKG